MKQNNFSERSRFFVHLADARKILKEKGVYYVVRAGIRIILDILCCYWYYKFFKSSKTFTFQKDTYNYFYHVYITTWRTERAVEIPIIWRMVEKYKGKKILEVGNVLSHYFPVHHDILDKYEKAPDVINQDVLDFQPGKNYDLIVSISTLEHVGWDENPREPLKILKAIENLKKLLAPKGKLVVTLPAGYNTVMDELLKRKQPQFTKMYSLKRISKDNQWKETNCDEIWDVKYNYHLFPSANGLTIGIIEPNY